MAVPNNPDRLKLKSTDGFIAKPLRGNHIGEIFCDFCEANHLSVIVMNCCDGYLAPKPCGILSQTPSAVPGSTLLRGFPN